MTVPNPYFINIELYWKDGTRPNQNQIARVDAYDVPSGNTWEGQSGYDPNTGGWQPVYMQNIAAFFPPREQPSLQFKVTDTQNQVVHTTITFENIASGSTVHIVIDADGQDWLVPGGGGPGDETWQVFGTITYSDGTPASDVIVAAYDVMDTGSGTPSLAQVGGNAKPTANGAYTITFVTSSFSGHVQPHTQPNLQVRVFSSVLLGQSDIFYSLNNKTQQVDLTVAKSSQGSKRRIYGTVRNRLGLPVPGISINAQHLAWTTSGLEEYDLDGTTTTGAAGSAVGPGKYEILYDLPPVDPAGPCGTPTGQINLIVFAKSDTTTLAKSAVIFGASEDQEVDLTVDRPAVAIESEYDLLDAAITACAGTKKADTLSKLSANPEYVSFVAQSSGQDEAQLNAYVQAWAIAGQINTKLANLGSSLTFGAEVIYALIRMGLGNTLAQLLDVKPERFYGALVDAIHGAIVPDSLSGSLNTLLDNWRTLLALLMTGSDTGALEWQQRLLMLVFPYLEDPNRDPVESNDYTKVQKIVKAQFAFSGSFTEFCTYLVANSIIDKGESENLKFVFEMYDAVHQYFSIVKHVYSFKGQFSWTTIKDLSSVPLQTVTSPTYVRGWLDYAKDALSDGVVPIPGDIPGKYNPPNELEKVTIYAQRLFDLFGNVGTQNQFGAGLKGNPAGGTTYDTISDFLKGYPDFDLQTGNIDQYVAAHKPALDTLDTAAVKSLQRVYRLTTDVDAALYLINAKLDSAVKIAQVPEGQFIVTHEQYVGGLTAAQRIHRTAVHYAGETLFTLVKFHQNLTETGGIKALPAAVDTNQLAAAASMGTFAALAASSTATAPVRFPNWVTLFGDLNKCICKECQTVLSPGAYFVDLLQYLKAQFDHELLLRRPDLLELEVTCENTNNMLPYIDLVNEILEAAVAPLQFTLPASLDETTLNTTSNPTSGDHSITSVVSDAFFSNGGYVLGNRAYIKQSAAYDESKKTLEWIIEDDAWRHVIRNANAGDPPYTALSYPQTSDNDSLAVFPEHYNVVAYNLLEQAVFPFNLPLALGKEQVDIFLKQRNVRRHEVLEAFTTLSIEEKLSQGVGTLAYLNLVDPELLTITGTKPGIRDWQYWGFGNSSGTIVRPDTPTAPAIYGTWTDLLAIVPVFLHRSGLSYQQLLDLLDAGFVHVEAVDQSQGVFISAPKDEIADCNYSQFTIENLNEATLRRISFFIRLWRKLGWTMRELNAYLMDLEQKVIPNDGLQKLFLVKRLCDELNVPPLHLFAWWRKLDTRRTQRIRKSLFDEVFLHGEPSQPEYQAIAKVAQGGDPIVLDPAVLPEGVDYVDYPAYLRGALKLSAAEIEVLWANIVDKELGILELTRIYRVVSFCKALKIKIADFFDLITLTDNTNPFTADSESGDSLDLSVVEQTYKAIREFQRARAIKLPPAEIGYFLRNASSVGDAFVPTQANFDAAVARIATATTAIAADNPEVASPDADTLTKGLAKIMPTDKVGRAVTIVQGPPALPPEPNPSDPDYTAKKAAWDVLKGAWDGQNAANRAFIKPFFAVFLPASQADAILDYLVSYNVSSSTTSATDLQNRYSLIWGFLHRMLLDQARTEAIDTVASELTSVDKDTADALLNQSLGTLNSPSIPAARDWKAFLTGGWDLLDPQISNVGSGIRYGSLIIATSGTYTFSATVPSGSLSNTDVSLSINGAQLSNTGTGTATISFAPVALTQNTICDVVFEYSGNAQVTLNLQINGGTASAIPSSELVGGAWRKPEATIDAARKGTRTTSLIVPKDGSYQFVANVLDVAASAGQLTLIVDEDTLPTPNPASADILDGQGQTIGKQFVFPALSLKTGSVHRVEFGYSGDATVSLLWKTDKTDPVLVPATAAIPFNADVYLKLFKAATLTKGLGLTKSELQYLNASQASIAFSLDALPQSTGAHTTPMAWETLASFVDLLNLNRTVALSSQTLFEFWLNDATSATVDDVAAETTWLADDIAVVLKLWASPPAWTDPALWYVLRACMSIVNRLDLRAELISNLLLVEPTISAAITLKNVYRSNFSKDTWSDTFKPLSDQLRQRQRDALVGYLTSGNDTYTFFDADDLYSYYLIDVQMEPDTLISRLKLALNSVQLYVERIFLGLEPDVIARDIDDAKEQWAWMRQYRVWEANRKVFLYPENWIEPELRDDKTPFFQELEQDLLQNEVSDERSRSILSDYLDKVAESSNLEVVGAYSQDVGASGINYILHVVGRTRSQSHNFYYRTFQAKQLAEGQWTPWRRIDLDIKADVAIPAVFNGRLHLVWPSVQTKQKSKPVSPDTTEVSGKNAAPVRADYEAEITLMWSQYDSAKNKWLKTCKSKSKGKDTKATKPFDLDLGEDIAPVTPYHLRIDEVSDDRLSLALVKTDINSSSSPSPTKLGSFNILASGHDTYDEATGTAATLASTRNLPESTVVKSNAAEEYTYSPDTRLKFKDTAPMLNRNPEMFRVYDTNLGYFATDAGGAENKPFFYETPTKSLFGQIKGQIVQGGLSPDQQTLIVQFQAFNHPIANQIQNMYQNFGPPGIMNRLTQALPKSDSYYYDYYNFHSNYYYNYYGSLYLGYYIAGDTMAWGSSQRKFEIEHNPTKQSVPGPHALPTVEFGYGTPFGIYNWELFFHAPMLIADRLSQDMQFEDAMHWYHYVFDPKLDLNPYEKTKRWARVLPEGSKYWNFLPFFANRNATESLSQVLGLKPNFSYAEKAELDKLIDAWRHNPFNPHLIARQRLVAYQKNVVMKYLDNLIAWADQLFRQDTFEAINEATQLYILAAQLLGKRPQSIESLIREPRYTYRELDILGLDHFSEAIADLEYLMVTNKPYVAGLNPDAPSAGAEHFQRLSLQTFYFTIPRNPKLDTYWDTVADRLFKIRNSMNIDGVKRQLALFEPPIEPGLLVRAAALGLDLSSVLSQLNAPLPLYRFNIWLQRATELCNELKGFGSALLAALEKKDAEALQLLRQDHEIRMLKLVRQVKQLQADEANANIEALNLSRKLAEERHDYYSSREKVSGQEKTQIAMTEITAGLEVASGLAHTLSGLVAPIPDMHLGMVGPFPMAGSQNIIGGQKLSAVITAAANFLSASASATRGWATVAGMNASYDRRWDDWKLQERLALDEMAQIDQQIVAAEIRLSIAEQELDNQDTQIEQSEEIQTFLQDKYTNKELYIWMISQLSQTYRQLYNLAYDVAKKAERTFQFELGIAETNYIQSSYFDSLKSGLLTGEKLIYDLKRMEVAYLEKNKREFEIQKPISLATINGAALQDLREKGFCEFDLPEVLFDLDFPGQYFRRIRAVRLTIPCVTGPHTNVSAKLSLTSSAIRINSAASGSPDDYAYTGYDDTRFAHDVTGIQSIATGSAQNDGGLFEINFKDERYLPFEGAGVISHWRLELPTAARQFDYDTISDVVIHLSYTARDAGGLLRNGAEALIKQGLINLLKSVADSTGLVRVFSLSKEFPDVFHQLLSQGAATMTLLPEHFPYVIGSLGLPTTLKNGTSVDMHVQFKPRALTSVGAKVALSATTADPTLPTNNNLSSFDTNYVAAATLDAGASDLTLPQPWKLKQQNLTDVAAAVEDIVLVVQYTLS